MTSALRAALFATVVLSPAICFAQTTPVCSISSDPEFGKTVEKAVPIGGGALVIAARQRRYLDALRGPQGQPLQIGTRTTTRTPNAIIDIYPVTWEGGQPFQLHLNSYRFGTPQAPQGLTCVMPLSRALGPPPVEGLIAAQELGSLGIDQGKDKTFAPVPLTDGGTTRALMYDYFRMMAALTRARNAAGQQVSGAVPRPAVVVVATPLSCGGTSVPATEIDALGPQDQAVQKMPALNTGAQLSNVLSGATVPEGGVGAMFLVPVLSPNITVRIRYGNAPPSCPADLQKEYRLPLRFEDAKVIASPMPPLPENNREPDPNVFVQAVLDTEGLFQRAIYVAGPESLREAGIAAVKDWRASPMRVNGEPIPTVVTLRVEFSR
jgi:hypothetical protein